MPLKVPLPLKNRLIDHTVAGKKARTEAFKSMGGQGEPPKVRSKPYRGPRPPKREPDPQHKYGNRSKADWRAMARGDGPLPAERPDAGPAVSEAAMYRTTKDHAKLPVTMEEIKKQAEDQRAAAEEKAASTSDVQHHDDPEFGVGTHRDDYERQAKEDEARERARGARGAAIQRAGDLDGRTACSEGHATEGGDNA